MINVYLTILFLIPVVKSYSLRLRWSRGTVHLGSTNITQTATDLRLRKLAVRTLMGTCCTLAITIANLSALLALDGETAWLCLLCCKIDIFFSAIVIHWVTTNAHSGTKSKHKNRMQSTSTDRTLVEANTALNGLSAVPSPPHPIHSPTISTHSAPAREEGSSHELGIETRSNHPSHQGLGANEYHCRTCRCHVNGSHESQSGREEDLIV
ncbi:hypothetical protein F4778DRAFT_744689 [Xylariomycetidae sp. FL2044]|nr:hypothetical protein F4778DRAFT_744689 [Xylariomycetidae sp. FL2044]